MNYKILKPVNLNEIILFTEKFKDKNIILDLLNIDINLDKIKLFKEITIQKNKNNTSFAIINSSIDIDKISDEINVVPTLQEAIDVIEMDEMMRDLK